MKIYLNKRDMKQLQKILGLGWTELKEDFFWALEVGMKSWKRFGLKSWTHFGLKSWKHFRLKSWTHWGWIRQHVFAGKKEKETEVLKEKREALKEKRKKRWNRKKIGLKLKGIGWTGRTETRYIFSIYFPSNLLRKMMVN